MKKLFLIIFLMSFTLFLSAQDTKEMSIITQDSETKHLKWEDNFEKAKKLSKKNNKLLLVFFTGSDWCGPCKMLENDFFETPEFIELAEKNLILYEADFPRRTDIVSPDKKKENIKLQRKYAVGGYPTIILLNANGAEVGRRKGYSFMRDPEPHFTLIKALINTYR